MAGARRLESSEKFPKAAGEGGTAQRPHLLSFRGRGDLAKAREECPSADQPY